MKNGMIRFVKPLQYLCLIIVIVLGLMTIIGTGGGGGGGGGSNGGGGSGGSTGGGDTDDDGGTAAVYPRFAYVANYSADYVSFYAVDNDTGRLHYQGKVAAGDGPYSVTVDPSGSYAYVANYLIDTVSQYMIGTGGALTPMTPATVIAGGNPCFVVTTGHFE